MSHFIYSYRFISLFLFILFLMISHDFVNLITKYLSIIIALKLFISFISLSQKKLRLVINIYSKVFCYLFLKNFIIIHKYLFIVLNKLTNQ